MTIRLSDMLFYAYHGVLEQERKEGNTFRVSVSITMPTVRGTETDVLTDTIDYSRLYAIVAHEMQTPSQLIEHVAWRIKKAIETFVGSTSSPQVGIGVGISNGDDSIQVSVTVAKQHPPVGSTSSPQVPGEVEWAEVTI